MPVSGRPGLAGLRPLRPRTPFDRSALERLAVAPRISPPVALAAFYLFGGALTLLSGGLGGWRRVDVGDILVLGTVAVVSGVAILLLRQHLTLVSCHVLVVLGSLLIAAAMVAGGGGAATATYSAMYIWVGAYSALFFPISAALGHVAWAVACHVVALVVLDAASVVAQTFVIFGSLAATAFVVGALVEQVRLLAATDPLTGLPNRRAFSDHLHYALARSERTGRPVALLALDLDGFKQVNDVEGHAAGDELLVEASRAWSSVLRKGELLARSGGDEFVVLLPETTENGARRVAARLTASTPEPLGVSIGIALGEGDDGAEQLLRRADEALYLDKAGRRTQV